MEVAIPTGSFNARATAASPSGSAGVTAQYGAEVVKDDRGVSIGGDIEASRWRNGLQAATHERNDDGSITTDSGAEWDASDLTWVARRNFIA